MHMVDFMPTRPRRFISGLLLLALGLGLASCSSTKLTARWDDETYSGPQGTKLLVVGMIKDVVTRRFFEEAFTDQVRKKGINVIASYEHIPNPTDHDEKEEVVALINKTGADMVLVAQLKGVQRDAKYTAGRLDWYPAGFYHAPFYNTYYSAYQGIYRPGVVGADSYVQMQLRLFSMANEEMVWAGNTSSKNPKSIKQLIRKIADTTISDIQRSGLL